MKKVYLQLNLSLFVSFLIAILISANIYPQTPWQSKVVYYGNNGKLVYAIDSEGNRIPDFSYAGYKNGEAPIPDIPVVKTISPVAGDNTQHIQSAIDQVGAMPLNSSGIRGALLLTAGMYRVSGTIKINYDGVVLRGVGQGADSTSNTIIYGTGDTPHQRSIIVAGGGNDSGWKEQVAGTKTNITSDTVYVGARSFTVADASMYQPGDNIIIFHPITDAWIAAVGGGGTATAPDWTVSDGINIVYNRNIKSIIGDTITIDAPVFNTLAKNLSQSYIYKYARTGLRTEIGVENLRVDIEAAGVTTDQNGNENHAWQAIDMFQIEDSWVKDCTMMHFGQSGVRFATATRVTVDSCSALDPISIITGERRYNYNMYHSAQLNLVENSFSRHSRHAFISNGTSTASGDVFYNDKSEGAYNSSEGHRWWTQGLLYDNVSFVSPNSTILLGLYSRGSYGTSHGWGAVNSVAWNCSVPSGNKIIIQKPPTAQNYAVGCSAGMVTGLISQGAPFDYPQGYIEGTNQSGLTPSSLYEAQVSERLSTNEVPPAPSNLKATAYSSRIIELNWLDNSFNETGFQIERSADNGTNWSLLATTGINITSYADTGLTASTAYYYRVRAKNSLGNSEYSDTAHASTAPKLPIAGPDSLTASAVSFDAVALSWIDKSDNEDGFVIERSTANDTAWKPLNTVGINVTQFADSGLKDSTEYRYRVRAENIYGYSDYSNTASAITPYHVASKNLALGKHVTCSSEQVEVGAENPCVNAVDGDVNTRWSSARDSVWPQWIEVDLDSAMTIDRTEVICYSDRAYQFTVDVKTDSNGAYSRVVDRSANTTPGTIDAPIVDMFDSVKARYVRLTVTGAAVYAGPWTSILEFRIFNGANVTAVQKRDKLHPSKYALFQNYPNPFNPSTVFRYQLPLSGNVTFKIYNILGKDIATLVNGYQNAGMHSYTWNGTDSSGKHVASGIYLARIIAGSFVKTIKLMLLK